MRLLVYAGSIHWRRSHGRALRIKPASFPPFFPRFFATQPLPSSLLHLRLDPIHLLPSLPPLPQLSMISRYKPIVDGNRNVYQPSRRRKGERWELVVIPSESLWLRPRKMVKPDSIPFSLSPLPLFSLSLSFPFFAIFVRSTVSTLEKR